jgi:hypothetical protein
VSPRSGSLPSWRRKHCACFRNRVGSQPTHGAARTVLALPEPAVALGRAPPGLPGPLADTLYPRERPKREDRNPIGPSGSRPAVSFNQVLSEARRAAGGIRPVYEGFR